MNQLLQGLKNTTNFGYTENGAVKRITTNSALLDLFGMGAAYRTRTDADVIIYSKMPTMKIPYMPLSAYFISETSVVVRANVVSSAFV